MHVAFNSIDYYHIAFRDHGLMNPLSEDRLLILAGHCGLGPESRILDVGSGKGRASLLLCRKWRCYSVQVDISEQWTSTARKLFEEQGLQHRTEIRCEDAAKSSHAPHSFDLAVCLGTALLYGGISSAMRNLTKLVRIGGHIILGEPSLDGNPPLRFRQYLDRTGWLIHSSRALLRIMDENRCRLLWSLRSTGEEWDRYMGMQWNAIHEYARQHPGDRQAQYFLEWCRDEQESYLRYQRHHLDWNVFLLRVGNCRI